MPLVIGALLLLVGNAAAEAPVPHWLQQCHVHSSKSPWYPKLLEAYQRVQDAGLEWNEETCEVTVPDSLRSTVAFCDVDARGPDRGIGDVVPPATCVIDARLDGISGLASLVARAEAASREAKAQAAAAAADGREARSQATDANASAKEALRLALQASVDAASAKADADGSRKAAEEAAGSARDAMYLARAADGKARRALASGGYFIVEGGAFGVSRNEVVVPYGTDGILAEGYAEADVTRRRTLRAASAFGAAAGIETGFAWQAARIGLALGGSWSPEKSETDSFETVSTNGFDASADLRLGLGSGTWKIGVGPSVAATMLGQSPSATPAASGVVVAGFLEIRYLASDDRRWRTFAIQLRAGDEALNTSVENYEQTLHAPWASVGLLVGIGGGPEALTPTERKFQ